MGRPPSVPATALVPPIYRASAHATVEEQSRCVAGSADPVEEFGGRPSTWQEVTCWPHSDARVVSRVEKRVEGGSPLMRCILAVWIFAWLSARVLDTRVASKIVPDLRLSMRRCTRGPHANTSPAHDGRQRAGTLHRANHRAVSRESTGRSRHGARETCAGGQAVGALSREEHPAAAPNVWTVGPAPLASAAHHSSSRPSLCADACAVPEIPIRPSYGGQSRWATPPSMFTPHSAPVCPHSEARGHARPRAHPARGQSSRP